MSRATSATDHASASRSSAPENSTIGTPSGTLTDSASGPAFLAISAALFESEDRLASNIGAGCHLHFGRVATARESSPALETRIGRGAGVEPYYGTCREKRAACAAAVAARYGAIDPCGLGGDPSVPASPWYYRDASVRGGEGRLHRYSRRPGYAPCGRDDRRGLAVGHAVGGDCEARSCGSRKHGNARGHRRRRGVVAGQRDLQAAGRGCGGEGDGPDR